MPGDADERVKIYFLQAVPVVTILINALNELEFETYSLSEQYSERLIPIICEDPKALVFICIRNTRELPRWFQFIDTVNEKKAGQVQFGILASDTIPQETRNAILSKQIPVITFMLIQQQPLQVVKLILRSYEAEKGRKRITVQARGIREMTIPRRGLQPIRGQVVTISSFAFSSEIEPGYIPSLKTGEYYPEVILSMKGIRIQSAAKLLGFNKKREQEYIFKFSGVQIVDGKFTYQEKATRDTTHKIHDYVKIRLKEELIARLEAQ